MNPDSDYRLSTRSLHPREHILRYRALSIGIARSLSLQVIGAPIPAGSASAVFRAAGFLWDFPPREPLRLLAKSSGYPFSAAVRFRRASAGVSRKVFHRGAAVDSKGSRAVPAPLPSE